MNRHLVLFTTLLMGNAVFGEPPVVRQISFPDAARSDTFFCRVELDTEAPDFVDGHEQRAFLEELCGETVPLARYSLGGPGDAIWGFSNCSYGHGYEIRRVATRAQPQLLRISCACECEKVGKTPGVNDPSPYYLSDDALKKAPRK